MASLESWFKEPELDKKSRTLLGQKLDWEGSIDQKIWDVDNKNVRLILEYCFNNQILPPEKIDEEIFKYYEDIEPKLSEEWNTVIFDILSSLFVMHPELVKDSIKNGSTPIQSLSNSLSNEIKIKEHILQKLPGLDPKIRSLVEISLKKILPSMIKEGFDKKVSDENDERKCGIYEKLAWVTDPDEQTFILKCFEEWRTPSLVNEAYADYQCIKEHKEWYDKSLAMSYIKKTNQAWDAVVNFDLFQEIGKYWEETNKYWKETIDYIVNVINKSKETPTVEELAYLAYRCFNLFQEIANKYWKGMVDRVAKEINESKKAYTIKSLADLVDYYWKLESI